MNGIGTQLCDPINSGLTQWRMAVFNKQMDAAAELRRNPASKHQIRHAYGDEQADAGRDWTGIDRLSTISSNTYSPALPQDIRQEDLRTGAVVSDDTPE